MRRKHWRSLFIVAVAYLHLAECVNVFAAASGNYTDLLPVGAAGNTTVISNGSGWSLTTTAPSQTFGDAISRAPMTVYQSTATGTISNTTAVSTFTALGQGNVGSRTFPASWIATGRSMRVTVDGTYSTTNQPTWTWALLLGTTTVLNTGAVNSNGGQTNQTFHATGIITVAATGAGGTVNGYWEVITSSASSFATAPIIYSTQAASVSVDLTSQVTVNPTFKWGTQSNSNTITANNVLVEFLN